MTGPETDGEAKATVLRKTSNEPERTPVNTTASSPPKAPAVQSGSAASSATIGSSISIKGDVEGDEDLLIEGRIEGEIKLRKNNVVVGGSGRVKADIYGKTISVEGQVEGNLTGDERVIVRDSGHVEGNIRSPRVTLEDGARFRGSIDMGDGAGASDAKETSETKRSGGTREKASGGSGQSARGAA